MKISLSSKVPKGYNKVFARKGVRVKDKEGNQLVLKKHEPALYRNSGVNVLIKDMDDPDFTFKIKKSDFPNFFRDEEKAKPIKTKKVKEVKPKEKKQKEVKLKKENAVEENPKMVEYKRLRNLNSKQMQGDFRKDEKAGLLTREEYESDPRLGMPFSTGRVGKTGQAITIGVRHIDRKPIMFSVTPHPDPHLRYLQSKQHPDYYEVKNPLGKKIPYERYVEEVKKLNRMLAAKEAKDIEGSKQSYEKQLQFDKQLKAGNIARIKFSNGNFSKEIRDVDWRNRKIGIRGSGTKLRWIPFNLIIDVTEKTP